MITTSYPTITMQDGSVIELRNGVDTGIPVPDAAIKDCLDAVAKGDFQESRRRCFVHAIQAGLPPELPSDRHYSFGHNKTFTLVP